MSILEALPDGARIEGLRRLALFLPYEVLRGLFERIELTGCLDLTSIVGYENHVAPGSCCSGPDKPCRLLISRWHLRRQISDKSLGPRKLNNERWEISVVFPYDPPFLLPISQS